MAHFSNIKHYLSFSDHDVINTGSHKIILGSRSRIPLLHFPQNTYFDTVTQILGKCIILIQVSGAEYSYRLSHLFTLEHIMLSSKTIVDEVLAFVTRAHSLKNPICSCNVNLQQQRIFDYGLCLDKRKISNMPCILLENKSQVSTENIQNEIGIPDIVETQIDDQSVFALLKQSGLLHQNTEGFWTSTHPQKVNCISLLHSHIRANIMGVDVDDKEIQYPDLFKDLHALQKKNSIVQPKCDQDICKLWERSK
jgi:hypothetical protein